MPPPNSSHPPSVRDARAGAELQPIVQAIAGDIVDVCTNAFGADLTTLLFHGSAVKGGIIAGSSDVDFVVIVRPEVLTAGNELPLARAIAFHRQLAGIAPAPFRYLQGHICSRHRPPGLGFIRDTYVIAAGSPDVPLATSEQLLTAAAEALANLDPPHRQDRLSNALLNHGEERLYREVRWLCTDVWPVSFQIACLVEDDGIQAWQRNKFENAIFLQHDPGIGPPLSRWVEAITEHYAAGEDIESGLAAIIAGSDFLDAAADWFARYRATHHTWMPDA